MVSSGTAVPRVRAPARGEYYSRMDGSGEFTRISIQSVSWVEGVLRQLVPYGPPTPYMDSSRYLPLLLPATLLGKDTTLV